MRRRPPASRCRRCSRRTAQATNKGITACRNGRYDPEDHFPGITKMVVLGSGARRRADDIALTRYASYFAAPNGDPARDQIRRWWRAQQRRPARGPGRRPTRAENCRPAPTEPPLSFRWGRGWLRREELHRLRRLLQARARQTTPGTWPAGRLIEGSSQLVVDAACPKRG